LDEAEAPIEHYDPLPTHLLMGKRRPCAKFHSAGGIWLKALELKNIGLTAIALW